MAKAKAVMAAPSDQLALTAEEIQAVMAARQQATTGSTPNVAVSDLAAALIQAINATKPPEKKTPFNRKKGGPWEPKDGSAKPRLRRAMFQHGVELNETNLSSQEITLLNKVKAGSYCSGFVRVIKRKDRGIDIDYPVRTASQRLKMVNQFGLTSFVGLLERLIEEASKPEQYKSDLDDDD